MDKNKGREKQQLPLKQVDDQPGRRIKLIDKQKALQLRWKNYEIDEDLDSINISQIIHGQKPSKIYNEIQKNLIIEYPKLSFQNYDTQQESFNIFQDQKNIKNQQQGKEKIESRIQLDKNDNINQIMAQQDSLKKIGFNSRRFSKSAINQIKCDFSMLKGDSCQQQMQKLSLKYKFNQRFLYKMYEEWKFGPNLKKYCKKLKKINNNKNKKKTIDHIKDILKQNPYLTPNQIRNKLKSIFPHKHFFSSFIVHQLKKAGMKKNMLSNQNSKNLNQNQFKERDQFLSMYRQREKQNNSKFFYLGECFLHKSLYSESFWADKHCSRPLHSNTFVQQGFTIITLLASDGNLLWQARMGDYQSASYNKLITKMMKKYCKKSQDTIIMNQSKTRNFETIIQITKKYNCSIIKLPAHSQFLSPLHYFFQELKENMRNNLQGQGETVLDELQKVVKSMNKFIFIERSKENIQNLEE